MGKASEKEILKEKAIGKLLALGLTEADLRALEIIK
jgi:hypothetical protein